MTPRPIFQPVVLASFVTGGNTAALHLPFKGT